MNEINKQQFEILKILNEEDKPVGSGHLYRMLSSRGIYASEAKVGRILSDMDRKNLTVKHGFKGRVISDTGKKALERMDNFEKQNWYGMRLLNIINSKNKQDIIDILIARRAIEREMARLAAINATEEDTKLMQEVLDEQEQLARKNEMTVEQDVKFHKQVEKASRNKVLAVAMDLIRQGESLSYILEYIRKNVKGTLAVEHANILKEIINHNPEGAEQAMIAHIESLIADVEKYWKIKYEDHMAGEDI